MEDTISTKDLKAKLDKKQNITLVETLAPERYREAHIPGALNIPSEKIKELAPQMLPNKYIGDALPEYWRRTGCARCS
jgi:rhodanese-related sulfurtransferase